VSAYVRNETGVVEIDGEGCYRRACKAATDSDDPRLVPKDLTGGRRDAGQADMPMLRQPMGAG